MYVRAPCVLFTRDPDLERTCQAYLSELLHLRVIQEPDALLSALHRSDPALLFFDVRAADWRALLPRVRDEFPATLAIVLAAPRSEPAADAEAAGVYAVEDPGADPVRLRALAARAAGYLRLLRENELLKGEVQRLGGEVRAAESARSARAGATAGRRLPGFSGARNLEALLDDAVESVTDYAKASRAGIFIAAREDGVFRLAAGARCLEHTHSLTVPPDDPLAHWLQLHAHLVSRAHLAHLPEPSDQILLKQYLDDFGAEVIVPLLGRGRIVGWLFVGRHVTGMPFGQPELEDLMGLSEQIAVALDNALLREEAALQTTLAETVLHSVPVGIAAVDADGSVRWLNRTAEAVFGIVCADALGRPASQLGGPIADLFSECLAGRPQDQPKLWTDRRAKRTFSALTRPLANGDQCLGAVAIVSDVTDEESLRTQRENLERAAFWTGLSSALSHEIRNPLVAVNTFAQLLPERAGDPSFCRQFGEIVVREIARLSAIVDQIDAFAAPRPLAFERTDLGGIVAGALADMSALEAWSRVAVGHTPPQRPLWLRADAQALRECFTHILTNAAEALVSRSDPRLRVALDVAPDDAECAVRFQDNAGGIPPEIRANVFSPFCTTKPRGIGLGLPIARRIVTDHGGDVAVECAGDGTCVTVTLPLLRRAARTADVTGSGG
jgi:PAS domain S-box-containing protein